MKYNVSEKWNFILQTALGFRHKFAVGLYGRFIDNSNMIVIQLFLLAWSI